MRYLVALAVVSVPLLLPLAAESSPSRPASNIDIKDNYFKYNNYRYYRNRAEDVEFTSFGDKRTPAAGPHYLNVQGKIKAGTIQKYGLLKTVPSGDIAWSTYKQSDVGAALSYFEFGGKVAGSINYNRLDTGHIVLLKLYMNDNKMINTINHASKCLDTLDKEGGDARIASAVWVVMEAELATYFQNTTTFAVSASSGALTIQAQGSGGKSGWQTITLTPGTTFAYDLEKVNKWGPLHDSVEKLRNDPQN